MAWLVCENQGGVSLLAVKQETWGAERMPMFPDEEPIREYQRKPKQRKCCPVSLSIVMNSDSQLSKL